MAAFAILRADIVETGMNQGDLVKLINNLVLAVNELVTDHATDRTELIAIGTVLADIKTQFDAHTHTQTNGDGVQTSIPDDTAGGIAGAGTDRVITDGSGSPAAAMSNTTTIVTTKG